MNPSIVWPYLFTCPAGDAENLAKDDLGDVLYNPVFSNREKLLHSCEGCPDCDMKDECTGPVEYTPVEAEKPSATCGGE